ncbi:MAG: gamma carbonic anhydrase family protein [Candidatus Methanoperedens sp.]
MYDCPVGCGNMLFQFEDKKPIISRSAFIAETACIVGDVTIGDKSSVWFNSVLRGDRGNITIGNRCNIQDSAVVHSDGKGVEIGDGVSIGHGCVIHGCRIESNVLVGMNATIMNGAVIGEFSIVGAGALVPENYSIPPNSVVLGLPCRHVRVATGDDLKLITGNSKTYEELAEKYLGK